MQCTEFRWRRHGEVLMIEAIGLMDFEDIEYLHARIEALFDLCPARSVIVDTRRSVALLSAEHWKAAQRAGRALDLPPTLPIAIIVPEHLAAIASQYTLSMAAAKRIRYCFTNLPTAWDWASVRREYWPWEPQQLACPSRDEPPSSREPDEQHALLRRRIAGRRPITKPP
jgi:hypothetical protein